jgi:ribosomal protein S18 acetylase RimI-like enzyme
MIRPARPTDTDTLVAMAADTGVFKPLEVDVLRELLDDFHDGAEAAEARAVVVEDAGRVIGFAYFAPTPMTDRTWHLYWIAVDKTVQARGTGGRLMAHVEAEVSKLGGRVLLIETSSLPSYDLTRRFYLKLGYDQEATVRDFYADGDHQVIFRKRL